MIKMYILGKDIHSAIELKENMIKQVNDCEHDMITNDVQCMSFLSSTRHPYYYLYHIYCHCCCYYEEFGFLFSHLSFSLSCFNSLFNFSESSLLPHSILQGLVPDAESYGMIIRSCGHRDLLVEGLKMLEEVTERGMSIKILFIRIPMQCREKSDLIGVIVGKSRGRRGGKVGGREDHFSLNQ